MQFFLPEHYAAFISPKPENDGPEERHERIKVRDAFLELDTHLWPLIQSSNWDLHRHHQKEHQISSYHFIFKDEKPIVNQIGSMWLHYGKSYDQLNRFRALGGYDYHYRDTDEYYNAFYLHTRIQVYIDSRCLRVWLIHTDKNTYDKSEFLKKIKPDSPQREAFWQLTLPLLDGKTFYEVGDQRMFTVANNKGAFLKFVRHDRGGLYSGFVREYTPEDPRISRENIVQTVYEDIKAFWPLYDFMAYRTPGEQ